MCELIIPKTPNRQQVNHNGGRGKLPVGRDVVKFVVTSLYLQIDDATGEQITYESFVEKVNTLACALNDRGLKKGDVVCLYAEKSILATVAVFAIVKLGAVMTPCRPSHTASKSFC